MYDPAIGQFISEDPIGFEASDPNLRRYVGNSPTNAIDPWGLEGSTTVETGVKGIKFFIEWLPNRNTGEIKILTKKGAELAIAKWIVNPQTGEITCNVVATHGKKILPGVAQSALKKIMPKLISEMTKNVQRLGGTWVMTKLADPARTGGRLGLGRAAGQAGRLGVGAFFGAIFTWFSLENTCQAAEIPRPERLEVDWESLGLTEEEILELSDNVESMLSEEERKWLDEEYQRRLQEAEGRSK